MTTKINDGKTARERYDEANTKFYGLKLNRKTDADLIAFLDASGNVQGTIKEALRKAMTLAREV